MIPEFQHYRAAVHGAHQIRTTLFAMPSRNRYESGPTYGPELPPTAVCTRMLAMGSLRHPDLYLELLAHEDERVLAAVVEAVHRLDREGRPGLADIVADAAVNVIVRRARRDKVAWSPLLARTERLLDRCLSRTIARWHYITAALHSFIEDNDSPALVADLLKHPSATIRLALACASAHLPEEAFDLVLADLVRPLERLQLTRSEDFLGRERCIASNPGLSQPQAEKLLQHVVALAVASGHPAPCEWQLASEVALLLTTRGCSVPIELAVSLATNHHPRLRRYAGAGAMALFQKVLEHLFQNLRGANNRISRETFEAICLCEVGGAQVVAAELVWP